MNPIRLGSAFRAIRLELHLRQSDVARRAGVSQGVVSGIECGRMRGMTLETLDTIAQAIGADFDPQLRWRGPTLPRLLDRRHAALQTLMADRLRAASWVVLIEESFNYFGDRGSVDLLAWHNTSRALLIAEIKTELVDLQETIRALDVKSRVVPSTVSEKRDWRPASVAVVLVLPGTTMNRSAVKRHQGMMDAALPARTCQVKRWLAEPRGHLREIAFVRYTPAMRTAGVAGPVRRVSAPRRTGQSGSPRSNQGP